MDKPQDMNNPQNIGGIVLEYLLDGIGSGWGNKIPKELNMRLDSCLHLPPFILQLHEGLVHQLHQNVGHTPPGYNHHSGERTSISICIGCVAVYFAVNLNPDAPNRGVDLCLDVVIDLNLDSLNGGLLSQKVTQHPVNLGNGEICTFKLLKLPKIRIYQTVSGGVAGGEGYYFGGGHSRNFRDQPGTV